MSEQDLEVFDNDDFSSESEKKRPTFIVVLAILSWIFVAFGVLSGIANSLSSYDKQVEGFDEAIAIYEEMDEMPMREDMIAFMEASKENIRANNLGNLILGLIEGFAVFMMFKLKRAGFWLYTVTQVGYLALLFYILPPSNIMTTFTFVFYIFIILLFEILYAVNLKYMK